MLVDQVKRSLPRLYEDKTVFQAPVYWAGLNVSWKTNDSVHLALALLRAQLYREVTNAPNI